ncbi:MAG: hypothetical protein JW852_06660 [Spirochaetales bacterium]|nr:hypothetical protein [Spirochaetales bacterium]
METEISRDESPVRVFVIPTDEEPVMAEDTYALTRGSYDAHTRFAYSFQNKDYRNAEREEAFREDVLKHPGIEKIVAKS